MLKTINKIFQQPNLNKINIGLNWRVFCPPNRIKDAQETVSGSQTWKQTFVYDRYGNRNFDAANTTTISGCPANQCNPTIDVANNRFTNGQGYSYDLSGNVINDAEGRTFIYDGENKQKEVKNSSNITVGTYFYDGDGKRIKKVTASEEIVFVYDAGGKLVAEYSSLTPQTTPTTRYLTSDHLGSPRIITDGSGAVLSRRDFAPFGEELYTGTGNRQTGHGYSYGDSTSQKFTSYERDNETELDFAQARMHSFQLGRFTTTDPLLESAEPSLPQSWNRYIYVLNNPLALIDPDGQKWEFENEELQKAFEEGVKANGGEKGKAWKAYQKIANAKGVVKVVFGDLGETQFGNSNISEVNYNTSWDVKNGKKVNFKSELTVNGTITIGSNKEALDITNFTDVVSASAHEFTHVVSELREAGVPGVSSLVPADGVTRAEEKAGKQSFPVESAAFAAQVQAEKAMVGKGNKPVSPDTSLGRANADFGKLTTPTEKYDYLSKTYQNFKQSRPGAQPAKKANKKP